MSMTPKEGEVLSEIIDFLAKRDDELAAKLRDVVEALVTADVQLSERISLLELDNGTWPILDDADGPEAFAGTLMDGLEETEPPTLLRRFLSFLWSPAQ